MPQQLVARQTGGQIGQHDDIFDHPTAGSLGPGLDDAKLGRAGPSPQQARRPGGVVVPGRGGGAVITGDTVMTGDTTGDAVSRRNAGDFTGVTSITGVTRGSETYRPRPPTPYPTP